MAAIRGRKAELPKINEALLNKFDSFETAGTALVENLRSRMKEQKRLLQSSVQSTSFIVSLQQKESLDNFLKGLAIFSGKADFHTTEVISQLRDVFSKLDGS